MKHLKLPFTLGLEYENWEFKLEPILNRNNNETYRYIGKDIKEFMNYPIKHIELVFELDILVTVKIIFKESSLYFFNQLEVEVLVLNYSSNTNIECIRANEVYLIYTSKKFNLS